MERGKEAPDFSFRWWDARPRSVAASMLYVYRLAGYMLHILWGGLAHLGP